jgi:hypothetical protein
MMVDPRIYADEHLRQRWERAAAVEFTQRHGTPPSAMTWRYVPEWTMADPMTGSLIAIPAMWSLSMAP